MWPSMVLEPNRESLFPNLVPDGYRVTSDETPEYNCVAWASEDSSRWWWPSSDYYWPEQSPLEESLASFRSVFEAMGYQECATDDLEAGFEKVAIFVDEESFPTHVARQVENGNWTSKLCRWQDIEHQSTQALAGTASIYGQVALLMRRPRSQIPD